MHKISQRLITYNTPLLPGMVKLKYEAMTENAFRFYRGTCHIFYEDLSQAHKTLPKSPLTWISGDLHIENYGSYKGDNRLVYFDLNDFDESQLAPASWELARMLTSIFVAFEALEIDKEEAMRMVQLFLRTYSVTLKKGKPIFLEPRTAKGIVCTFLEKAANRKLKELLAKRTELKKGKLILSLTHKHHFKIDKKLRAELLHHITEWIATSNDGPYNFKAMDVVFRFAGTGSIGVKRYMFLLRSAKTKKKCLLIDMKQMRSSCLSSYVNVPQPEWSTEAERVLAIQQRMQDIPPALLSTTTFRDDDYLIQEMQPSEDRIDFDLIKERYRDIYQVIDDMAALTASAQLRSSGRQGSAIADELIAFGSNTDWHDALIAYAQKYTKQVKKDYKNFVDDYKKGVFDT